MQEIDGERTVTELLSDFWRPYFLGGDRPGRRGEIEERQKAGKAHQADSGNRHGAGGYRPGLSSGIRNPPAP